MSISQWTSNPYCSGNKDDTPSTFWRTQPVVWSDENTTQDGPIILPTPEAISKTPAHPFPLPGGYQWCMLDVTVPEQNEELYQLLCKHYIEFNDSFRFRYSSQFLHWALCPPGYCQELHLGIRESSTQILFAFIAGVPSTIRIRASVIDCVVVNFLCVHKRLRSRRLTPILIQELSRKAVHLGLYFGVYTSAHNHQSPVSTVTYHHRILNVPKLVEVGFFHVARNATIGRTIRLHQAPLLHKTLGFRKMKSSDTNEVMSLYNAYFTRFGIAPVLNELTLHHFLLGGLETEESIDGNRARQVVWAYVAENPTTKKITGFVSFYSLPLTVMKSGKDELIDAAYLFYYAVDIPNDHVKDVSTFHNTQVQNIVHDAVVEAGRLKFDVLTVATWMENQTFLQSLQFERGSGYMHYFLHNWRTAPMARPGTPSEAGEQIGLIVV